MKRCQCENKQTEKRCTNEAIWAWQPFGPDEYICGSFAALGSHYRGFPVVPICDEHKERIDSGLGAKFTCRGRGFEHLGGGEKIIINTTPL